MAKEKKPAADQSQDRHKPHQMVRVPIQLYAIIKSLAKKNRRPTSWQVIALLEDQLRTLGVLPPEAEPPDSST